MYIHAKAPRGQLLQNNHKHGSRTKDFNKAKINTKKGPPQDTIARPRLKLNPARFGDPYDHVHHMEHTHEDNHLIDTQEQDMENNKFEEEKIILRDK